MAPRRTRKPLTVRQILTWVDAHRARHGEWPNLRSGPLDGTPGESWSGINTALTAGKRGLPGGFSLARLLRERRGMEERRGRSGPSRTNYAQRERIAKLRARGLTFEEIGSRLGISRQAAHRMLKAHRRSESAADG